MEIKYGKENFVKFLNYIDDKEKEEEKKEEDILKKINKIEEEESSLKEKNKILFGTKEEDFLKNKKGKTLREIYNDYCSYYSKNKVENCLNEIKNWNKLMSSAIDLPELQKKFDEYKKYEENRREEEKEFSKKLSDEIENNELFQKMKNLFLKFKEKVGEEVDNMYKKMINLDKYTINLFEEKMGKFEENELFFFLDHFGHWTQKYTVFFPI